MALAASTMSAPPFSYPHGSPRPARSTTVTFSARLGTFKFMEQLGLVMHPDDDYFNSGKLYDAGASIVLPLPGTCSSLLCSPCQDHLDPELACPGRGLTATFLCVNLQVWRRIWRTRCSTRSPSCRYTSITRPTAGSCENRRRRRA